MVPPERRKPHPTKVTGRRIEQSSEPITVSSGTADRRTYGTAHMLRLKKNNPQRTREFRLLGRSGFCAVQTSGDNRRAKMPEFGDWSECNEAKPFAFVDYTRVLAWLLTNCSC